MISQPKQRRLIVSSLILLIFSALFHSTIASEPLQPVFLGLEDGKKAIINEATEPYFSLLQTREMEAKVGARLVSDSLQEQRNECRKIYQEHVLEFTIAEKKVLEWAVSRIQPLLAVEYPELGKIPWKFLKISERIEGGLPHTRHDIIVLPEGTLEMMVEDHSNLPEDKALLAVAPLLVHEKLHILQRSEPHRFLVMYAELWRFRKVSHIDQNAWLSRNQLVNPDGVDCSWIFPLTGGTSTNWILPLIVLNEAPGIARMPDDFEMVAIQVEEVAPDTFSVLTETNGLPRMTPLFEVSQYLDVLRHTTDIYHPHEAAADLFSEVFIWFHLVGEPARSRPRAREFQENLGPLKEWFKRVLNSSSFQGPPTPKRLVLP